MSLTLPTDPTARLAHALCLALTAPVGREAEIDDLVQFFALGLAPAQVTRACDLALAQVEVSQ